MTKLRHLIPLALSVAFATNAHAACLTDAQAADLVANYLARIPAANIENLSDADGACTRAKVNALLAPRLGKVGNDERGGFGAMLLRLHRKGCVRGVANPRRATSPAAVCVLHPPLLRGNVPHEKTANRL